MYSMLVPAEDSELYNDERTNTVKMKYVLSERDYFTYNEAMGLNSFAPESILTQELNYKKIGNISNVDAEGQYAKVSLTCDCCSDYEPIMLKDK